MLSATELVNAQDETSGNYEFGWAPDLWYNSVDGVQVGIQGSVREFGRINEGPHFLDAGILIGTAYPDLTFNYRLGYRHTIWSTQDLETVGITLNSTYRDGFQQHGAGLNLGSRDDLARSARNVAVRYYAHELFDDRYQIYDHLWNEGWTDILRFTGTLTNWGDWHRNTSINIDARVSPGSLDTEGFARLEASAQHKFSFTETLGLNVRAYAGWISEDAPSPYHLNFAGASIIDLQESRFTRARGSLPPSWTKDGFLHKAGGANLRGFQQMEAEFREVTQTVHTARPPYAHIPPTAFTESVISINSELEFPNPVNRWVQSSPVIGEFIKFSSYLFNDVGMISIRELPSVPPHPSYDSEFWLVNAGLGFELSFNLPDYLGRKRGFQLRLDLPFWFYDSNEEETEFDIKPILGLGSIFKF